MLPCCPQCDQTFDFKDVTSFVHAKFYQMLEKKDRNWMNYEMLPGIEGGQGGCACCGYQHHHLPMSSSIADVAKKDPDSDWRIHLEAPLSERHYQRQGDGLWVLYK